MPLPYINTVTLSGVVGVTYPIPIRVRGALQLSRYTGGSNDGAFFQSGGVQNSSDVSKPQAKLVVSDPAVTYFLNRTTDAPSAWSRWLDYMAVIEGKHGATLTLSIVLPNPHVTEETLDGGGGMVESGLVGLQVAKQWVAVDYVTDITKDVSEKLGGVVRNWLWSGFEENMYGVGAER